ncbi:hypothetical protein ACP70R_025763 [Stipagrostis hirtigluma subsp. patula]
MLGWGGRPAPLLAALLSASLLLVVGSHQEFHEAAGSRILLQTNPHKNEVIAQGKGVVLLGKLSMRYLMPFVEKEKYQLPSKCRLYPDNDMFREQEQHKIHFDINEWRCGFCKKAFRAEKFLDQHFENRHKNLVDNSQGRCLADLSGALHCDLMMEFKKPKSKCNAAAAERNRHVCESLADSCFPINQGLSASRLHEFFLRQFCDAHTCSRSTKPFPKGGRETNKQVLLGSLHLDTDTFAPVLSHSILAPEANEERCSRSKAIFKNWAEEKAILVSSSQMQTARRKHV